MAAHCMHEVPFKKLPAAHVEKITSASVKNAPACVAKEFDVKRTTYVDEAGSVNAAGIVKPDHRGDVQPSAFVTQRKSEAASVRNDVKFNMMARGEPGTDTVSAQSA